MKEASPEQILWEFIRDHDGEYMRSDLQKAMGTGRGVSVRKVPILLNNLINKQFVILEPRKVEEGGHKKTRKFVSVAPFLRDMSPDDRGMWWESQTQTGYNDPKEQKA